MTSEPCPVCARTFRTPQGLGGHRKNFPDAAHRAARAADALKPNPAAPAAPRPAPTRAIRAETSQRTQPAAPPPQPKQETSSTWQEWAAHSQRLLAPYMEAQQRTQREREQQPRVQRHTPRPAPVESPPASHEQPAPSSSVKPPEARRQAALVAAPAPPQRETAAPANAAPVERRPATRDGPIPPWLEGILAASAVGVSVLALAQLIESKKGANAKLAAPPPRAGERPADWWERAVNQARRTVRPVRNDRLWNGAGWVQGAAGRDDD